MAMIDFLLGLMIVLQLLDVHSTWGALARGGVEKNPVVRWLMDRLGRGWIVVKLAIGCGGAWAIWWSGLPWAPAMLAGGCVLYALVIVRNYRVLR